VTETIPPKIMGNIIRKILSYSGEKDKKHFFRYDIYKYQIKRYVAETERFSREVYKIFDKKNPNWYKDNMIDKLEDHNDLSEYLLNSFIAGKELTNLLHGMDGRSNEGKKEKREAEIEEAQRKYKEVKSVIDKAKLSSLQLIIRDSKGKKPKKLTGKNLMLYNQNLLGRLLELKVE